MKKLLALAMSLLIVSSIPTAALAWDGTANMSAIPENGETIDLLKITEDADSSDYEKGREVMLSLGVPAELIDDMDRAHVERYADSTAAVTTTQYVRVRYYMEDGANKANPLLSLNKSNDLFVEVLEEDIGNLTFAIEVIDKETFEVESEMVKAMQDQIQNSRENDVQPMTLTETELVFNSYLELKSMATKKSNGRYLLSGRYEWKTNPQGLPGNVQKDIFAIAPARNGDFIDSTEYAISKAKSTHGTMNGTGTWSYTYKTHNKEYNGYNEMDYGDAGFGINIPIYRSSETTNRVTQYHSYMGYVSGEMVANSSAATTMKICVNYAKNKVKIDVGISVGIPKSASISITPSTYHDKPVRASLMFKHPSFEQVS